MNEFVIDSTRFGTFFLFLSYETGIWDFPSQRIVDDVRVGFEGFICENIAAKLFVFIDIRTILFMIVGYIG